MSGTLVKFLQQLKGATVQIELKDSSVVSGEVVAVEPNMNMDLRTVRVVAKGRDAANYAQFAVRGTSIRHIKLPEELQYDKMISSCIGV